MAVSQGIDTQDDQSEVLKTVHGLFDNIFIKELSKKTHRGLEGRALQGFGYTNAVTPQGVRLQINETEAAVVRHICQMAADGVSLRGIAKRLNAQAAPSTRPRTGKRYATWCPSAIRAMRELRTITQQLLSNQREAVMPQLSELRDFILERLTNIRALVTSNVEHARVELAKHINSITLQPQGAHYEATGDWNVVGKEPANREGGGMRVWMVAGDGFEPPTFGL